MRNVTQLLKRQKRVFNQTSKKNGIMSNKNFQKTINTFLTYKKGYTDDFITIDKNGEMISIVKTLVEVFKGNCKNILENLRIKPNYLGDSSIVIHNALFVLQKLIAANRTSYFDSFVKCGVWNLAPAIN